MLSGMRTSLFFLIKVSIHSCLLYSVQAWQLGAEEMSKKCRNVEIGIGLVQIFKAFRKRFFSRKNAPKNNKDKSIPEDEVDWFILSNEAIREITKTTEIKNFFDMQHIKYIAHVMCRQNSSLIIVH